MNYNTLHCKKKWSDACMRFQELPVSTKRSDLEDQTWVHIIEVLDVRVLLQYVGIVALLAYCLQRLSFPHHVYLVARLVAGSTRRPKRCVDVVPAARNE